MLYRSYPISPIITGEKGVGKTCLVETATRNAAGVIDIEVNPGDNEKVIVESALRGVTNLQFSFFQPGPNARRVIFFYKLMTFGRTPIVVINATERKLGQEYASLTGAVRTLTGVYQLRAIVDGSPNALDESLFRTKRGLVMDVQPIPQEMIWKLPQFQQMFKLVDKASLGSVVWKVLGGVPANYLELQS